ncbi:MAG: helix-hairpin-helix domain-containing protein [Phycisphaerae bacterium]
MKRSGMIMYAVLVITALMMVITASLLFWVRAEQNASTVDSGREQAYQAAMSGLREMITAVQTTGSASELRDEPDLFRDRLVMDDGVNRWYFTIYAYNPTDPDHVRYGLVDEASKINVNVADPDLLTAAIQAADPAGNYDARSLTANLMDWRDKDDELYSATAGAEQAYYDRLGYVCKNGMLRTIDELLLIRGFDAQLVYGEDVNLNGLLDENERDQRESFPFHDDGDDELNRGLRSLLTAVSYEPNTDSRGNRRVAMDSDPAALAQAGLSEQTVEFIKAYRQDRNEFSHPVELLNMTYEPKQRGRGPNRRGQPRRIESGITPANVDLVLDRLTVNRGRLLMGLVNVNTAEAKTLECLPGISDNLAGDIVAHRATLTPERKRSVAWLLQENLLDVETFKKVAPSLTTRSYQYRAMIVGFGRPAGGFRIFEAVVNVAGEVGLIYLRDLTHVGLPFALDQDLQEY